MVQINHLCYNLTRHRRIETVLFMEVCWVYVNKFHCKHFILIFASSSNQYSHCTTSSFELHQFVGITWKIQQNATCSCLDTACEFKSSATMHENLIIQSLSCGRLHTSTPNQPGYIVHRRKKEFFLYFRFYLWASLIGDFIKLRGWPWKCWFLFWILALHQ